MFNAKLKELVGSALEFSSSCDVELDSAMLSRELRTVHINIGRRTGKTRYIAENSVSCDLVIVHNESPIDEYRPIDAMVVVAAGIYYKNSKYCYRGEEICFSGKVWVDEPRLCCQSIDMESIYAIANGCHVVMLGE